MIDFFSLPKDILIHIYQYDPTYYEVYNQVLQSFNRTSLMKDYLENEKKESTLNISLFLYVRKHSRTFSRFQFEYLDYCKIYYEIHDSINSLIDSHKSYSYIKDFKCKTNKDLYNLIKKVEKPIKYYKKKWIIVLLKKNFDFTEKQNE